MNTQRVLTWIALVGVLIWITPLQGAPVAAQNTQKLNVVATFSILGDVVQNIGGDAINLTVIVGADGDAHTFEPSPEQIGAIADANVIVENGLGFESWLNDMVDASGTNASRVVASSGVKPLTWADEKAQEAFNEAVILGKPTPNPVESDDDSGEFDPHVWQDVSNVIAEVAVIRDALSAADPANAARFDANATAYSTRLEQLDQWLRDSVASLPSDKRVLFTSHDALGYFARAYGFTIVGSALGSLSTEAADPSAGDVAHLIDEIKASGVPAIFAESIENTDLMDQVASDANVEVAPPLYVDALSRADGPAATYIDLVRSNVTTIVSALGGSVSSP